MFDFISVVQFLDMPFSISLGFICADGVFMRELPSVCMLILSGLETRLSALRLRSLLPRGFIVCSANLFWYGSFSSFVGLCDLFRRMTT